MKKDKQAPKKLLELSHDEARNFFLKHESYFNADLPPYFQFEELLHAVANELGDVVLDGAPTDGTTYSSGDALIANGDTVVSYGASTSFSESLPATLTTNVSWSSV